MRNSIRTPQSVVARDLLLQQSESQYLLLVIQVQSYHQIIIIIATQAATGIPAE